MGAVGLGQEGFSVPVSFAMDVVEADVVEADGVSLTLLTRDGRHIVGTSYARLGWLDEVRHLADRHKVALPVKVTPCLDPRSRPPVEIGEDYLARVVVMWRTSAGQKRTWQLPDREIDVVPQPTRVLPPLFARNCRTVGSVVYVGLVSDTAFADIAVSLAPSGVVAHGGVAHLTMLLTNVAEFAVPLGHDGARVGSNVRGMQEVLGPYETVAVPVELPMSTCAAGWGMRRVPARTYLVTNQALLATGWMRSSLPGAVVVVR